MATMAVVAVYILIFCCIPARKIGDVYPRVISPQTSSLVIGTSRAAQGVNPEILNGQLSECYPNQDLYNFAFHIDETTYNPSYSEAILKKLLPDSKNGLFILTVDPWAFKKEKKIIGELDLHSVSTNPNIEFLLRFFDRTWISPVPTNYYINDAGRTIVTYKRFTSDAAANMLSVYRKMADNYAYSPESEREIISLVQRLQPRGDIYMVRMPVSGEMVQLEDSIMPDFTAKMRNIAAQLDISFFDFIRNPFKTNDGTHLSQAEGDRFSTMLADSIRYAVQH